MAQAIGDAQWLLDAIDVVRVEREAKVRDVTILAEDAAHMHRIADAVQARVCAAIAEDPEKVSNLTVQRNVVAIVTDGTAVLGLGDIGPEAALPVMEGKAMLFKEFAGVDAWPVCLGDQGP